SFGSVEVIELLVVALRARQFFGMKLGHLEARRDAVDGIHRARVINVVAGDERRVERSGKRGVEELIDEILVPFIRIPEKDSVQPEVLSAGVRVEIFPFRVLGIFGGIDGARTDVAEAAGHADPIWAHQVFVAIVIGIVIVPDRIPFFLSRFVESGIGKESEADDAARVAVVGAGRNGLPACSNFHAWIFLLILEWGGSTDSFVEPEAEAVGIATLSIGFGVGFLVVPPVAALGVPLLESRLVHQAEVFPAVLPRHFVELPVVALAIVVLVVSQVTRRIRRRWSFILDV